MRVKKNYIKRVLKFLGITALTIICYILAHEAATAERGYEAIGGEIFAAAIPFLILWFIPFAIKDTVKAVKGDDVDQ